MLHTGLTFTLTVVKTFLSRSSLITLDILSQPTNALSPDISVVRSVVTFFFSFSWEDGSLTHLLQFRNIVFPTVKMLMSPI